jgi:tetratricopeptide (TPR) repeat protein
VDVSDALGEIKKEKMLSIAQAKADFQKALSYKDDAGLYDGIAQCHSAQGAFDDAITFFGDAIEKDKENVCFLRHRADTYCKQRIFKKALEDLESALIFSREDEE